MSFAGVNNTDLTSLFQCSQRLRVRHHEAVQQDARCDGPRHEDISWPCILKRFHVHRMDSGVHALLRSCDQLEQEQGDYDDPRSRISASTKLRLEKPARSISRYSSKLSSRTSPSRGSLHFFLTLAVGIHFHRSTRPGNYPDTAVVNTADGDVDAFRA
ncbi:hypothetical protein B0H13DRAFT_1866863 [Mycena leptocephala]|nr:hypothetical protein B0H13DRAFT_1866863 [Mycena leptocephala]